MVEGWVPLSVRTGRAERDDALNEGIPVWLRSSLWVWVRKVASHQGPSFEEKLREIERHCRLHLDWSLDLYGAEQSLKGLMERAPDSFLDVVDFLLYGFLEEESVLPDELEAILEIAGSAWRVVLRDEDYQLERRVPEPMVQAAEQAMDAGRAGELLALAWKATYGRSPNPSAAYREAVRAVEAAAQPIITPRDRKATLGKMITAFRDGKKKWAYVFKAGTDQHAAVLGMMQLLWSGQHDRHGTADDAQPIHVDQAEAEAAVHLAVTLVQWFDSGAISRR